jgi:DNA-binding response OmpR family regulator
MKFPAMAEILLVDDERSLREGLKAVLVGEGFGVRTARDGIDALDKFTAKRPDAVLLDVMMPKMNGFKTCEEIRRLDALVPIVFLTAKDSEVDEIRGMGLGGDDYISKSVGEEVLLARLRRTLERAGQFAEAKGAPRRLTLATVKVDLERRIVYDGNDTRVLTSSEADLLRCLASAPGEPFSTDKILSFLRGEGYIGDPATVRMHVMNLRRKLGRAGSMIANLQNSGYYLVV